jgi:glycosyltransferase involved in cell wall biosynthesis
MPPFPTRDGGRLRVFHLAAGLARRGHAIRMIAFDDDQRDEEAVEAMAAEGVRLTLVPHRPTWSGAAVRSIGARTSLYAARFRSHRFRESVDRALAGEDFDVVQVEYGYMGRHLEWLASRTSAALVLDEHNLEWELAGAGRTTAPRGMSYRAYARRERRLRLREEVRAARRADRVLTVSERDRERLLAAAARVQVSVVPNGVDLSAFHPSGRPEGDRAPLAVFVGKLDYGPNVDGLQWFVSNGWPIVRAQHPEARLRIVGRTPGPAVADLGRREGVDVVGEVPDVRPHVDAASVVVVPLRAGGGTRLKILEALALRRPVVSTTVGAAGLNLSADSICIADEPGDLGRLVGRLLADPALRASIAARGQAEVLQRFGWNGIVERLDAIHAELAVHRRASSKSGLL